MADNLEIRLTATGLDAAAKQLDPQRVYEMFVRIFDEAPRYVKGQLTARAPAIVRAKIKIKRDTMRPPKWALIGSTHPLAHIFEGGTSSRGAAGFNHAGRHFPRVTGRWGLMETMGLPRAEAFAVALAIEAQGGLSPQPFVAPTLAAVAGPVEQMCEKIVDEVVRGAG